VSETAASALACPSENPELFPDMEIALQVEKMFLGQRDATAPTGIPAADYLTAKDDLDLNLIALIKSQSGQSGQSQPLQSPEAESKVPEPEDDDGDDDNAAQMAAEAEAQMAAEAEAEAEAAAEKAEEERLAAEAAAADGGDDFGDEW
jgi:coatomer subunit beta'